MQHGTKTAYETHKCRCEPCRAWKTAKGEADRAALCARVKADDPTLRHGTQYLYSKGNCRCDACCGAASAAKQKWQDNNPGANARHVERWQRENREHIRAYEREQAKLAGVPGKHGDIWTGPELEIVSTRTDLSLTELARMLGRTRSAVADARHRCAHDPKWMKAAGALEA